jgi:hypothetical protein
MIPTTQASLLEELKNLKMDSEVQKETNQIYHIFKMEKREFPLFIRILHEGELLQFLVFFPVQVKAEQYAEIARFLHMLNKELDMPGFCLDESSSTVFYRVLLPTHKKELAKEVLGALLNTIQLVCKTFSPAIETLCAGVMKLSEMLKQAKKSNG